MLPELLMLTPRMLLIVSDASHWAAGNGKTLIWTEFLRSHEDQMKYYEAEVQRLAMVGKPASLAVSKRVSVHEFGRGADCRLMDDEELNKGLVWYINSRYHYDPNRPALKTAIIHTGTGPHVHFQSMT